MGSGGFTVGRIFGIRITINWSVIPKMPLVATLHASTPRQMWRGSHRGGSEAFETGVPWRDR
jgi:hypothetical protein